MSVPIPLIWPQGEKNTCKLDKITYLVPTLPAITDISRRINTLGRLPSLAKRLGLLACLAKGITVREDEFKG